MHGKFIAHCSFFHQIFHPLIFIIFLFAFKLFHTYIFVLLQHIIPSLFSINNRKSSRSKNSIEIGKNHFLSLFKHKRNWSFRKKIESIKHDTEIKSNFGALHKCYWYFPIHFIYLISFYFLYGIQEQHMRPPDCSMEPLWKLLLYFPFSFSLSLVFLAFFFNVMEKCFIFFL